MLILILRTRVWIDLIQIVEPSGKLAWLAFDYFAPFTHNKNLKKYIYNFKKLQNILQIISLYFDHRGRNSIRMLDLEFYGKI